MDLFSYNRDKFKDAFTVFKKSTPRSFYEWTEERRILSKGTARPGRWNHDTTPYLKEVFRAYDDPAVEIIVLMIASQMGKSELMNCLVGHTIDEDPSPTLFLFPKDDLAFKYSRIRLTAMFNSMPFLLDKMVNANHSRKSDGKVMLKVFKGGYLILSGANSPSNLASWPVKRALIDELDRTPDSAMGEGSVVELVRKRQMNFDGTKLVLSSTPTTEDRSKINKYYQISSGGKYYVPCPFCGKWILLRVENIEKVDSDRTSASDINYAHRCGQCHTLIPESRKRTMVLKGKWVHSNPGEKKIRGFNISGLYSVFGTANSSWGRIRTNYENCLEDEEKKKVFFNTDLALPCGQDVLENIEWGELRKTREDYVGPEHLCLTTCAVDIQKDRLEYEIHYWGPRFECHPLEHGVIKGLAVESAPWKKLRKVLLKKYPWRGGEYPLDVFGVDTGYLPDTCFQFVKIMRSERVNNPEVPIGIGLRGTGTGETIIRYAPEATVQTKSGKKKKRQQRYLVNSNIAKDLLFRSVKQSIEFKQKLVNERPKSYYYTWSSKKKEYYKQLASEESYMAIKDGRPVVRYRIKEGVKNNEILDLWVYNLAMAHKYMSNDIDDDPYWDMLSARRRS